ncbi:MAG: hypothetical protein WDN31_10860 [Hyphomicrobium sp.]
MLLVDRLPAGFEIDNPHLVDSGDVKALDWLKSTVQPEHSEFRDDRFVAAFNFSGGIVAPASEEQESTPDGATNTKGPAASATVAYLVRAVTPAPSSIRRRRSRTCTGPSAMRARRRARSP